MFVACLPDIKKEFIPLGMEKLSQCRKLPSSDVTKGLQKYDSLIELHQYVRTKILSREISQNIFSEFY